MPDIVVVGEAAGGVEALKELVKALPADLPAAVFVTLHVPAHSKGALAKILSSNGALPALQPEDGEEFQLDAFTSRRPIVTC